MANNSQRQVLDEGQLEQIGPLFSALLLPGAEWIHRRRESVRIVDETALKRQISVDFTLPSELNNGTQLDQVDELGFPAPVFVLPKAPARLMSFDMVDASGKSLPLMTSAENRDASAATLVAMANTTLEIEGLSEPSLSDELLSSLGKVARDDTHEAEGLANQLFDAERLNGLTPALTLLLKNERFCFWLSTLAHSSIIPVWCLGERKREIVKLSFREPIKHELPLASTLGWSPYELSIASSYIEAQNHHFEAVAPHGMRIAQARLASDSDDDEHEDGLLRRLHLYLPSSERAGGALAKVDLRVSARGFLRDAWLPALLVTGCLAGAWLRAEEIVSNPNSSPSLFLLLPGLIATYLSRPDRHALTSRLLSSARMVLMGTALFAFVAAGSVAFLGPASADQAVIDGRTEHLKILLGSLFVLSALASALLFFARGRANHNGRAVLKWLRARVAGVGTSLRQVWSGSFSFVVESEMTAEEGYQEIEKAVAAAIPARNVEVLKLRAPFEYELVRATDGPAALHLETTVSRLFRGSRIACEGWGPSKDERRFPGWRIGVWWMGYRLWREIHRRFRRDEAKAKATKTPAR
jgi:hypothetical protein